MIKKILIILLLLTSFLFIDISSINAWCTTLDWCLSGSDLVNPWNAEIWAWEVKSKILGWVTKIWWFFGLMAIWAIVWGAFMMVISAWEEEKVKKAKDMVKWSIIWFLWIVLASSLIALVVNFMYNF